MKVPRGSWNLKKVPKNHFQGDVYERNWISFSMPHDKKNQRRNYYSD
jgi:hypothetical protein